MASQIVGFPMNRVTEVPKEDCVPPPPTVFADKATMDKVVKGCQATVKFEDLKKNPALQSAM